MKLLISALFVTVAVAFSPAPKTAVRKTTALEASRREAIVAGLGAVLAGAAPAVASQAGIGSDRNFAKDNEFISAQVCSMRVHLKAFQMMCAYIILVCVQS